MTQPSPNFLPSRKDFLSQNDVISSRALLGSLKEPVDPSLGLRNNDISDASQVNQPHFDIYRLVSSLPMSMSSIAFLAAIFKSVAITGMVLGGVVVFIPQYVEIWRSGNPDGFSTHVCLIMIIANLLRLCFWFAVRAYSSQSPCWQCRSCV